MEKFAKIPDGSLMAIKTFLIRSVGRAALTSPGATLFACDCSAAGEKHQLEFGTKGFPETFLGRPARGRSAKWPLIVLLTKFIKFSLAGL